MPMIAGDGEVNARGRVWNGIQTEQRHRIQSIAIIRKLINLKKNNTIDLERN